MATKFCIFISFPHTIESFVGSHFFCSYNLISHLQMQPHARTRCLITCAPHEEFICSRCVLCSSRCVNRSPRGTAAESRIYLLLRSLLYVGRSSTTLLQSCPCCQRENWPYCELRCIVLAVWKMLNGLLVENVCTALPTCEGGGVGQFNTGIALLRGPDKEKVTF